MASRACAARRRRLTVQYGTLAVTNRRRSPNDVATAAMESLDGGGRRSACVAGQDARDQFPPGDRGEDGANPLDQKGGGDWRDVRRMERPREVDVQCDRRARGDGWPA